MAKVYSPKVVKQVRDQMAKGISMKCVAKEAGLKYYEVGAICDLHSIPRPGRGSTSKSNTTLPINLATQTLSVKKSVSAPQVSPTPYELSIDDQTALLATSGRYRELQNWADSRGLSMVQAQQRWHAVRITQTRGSVR